MLMKAMKINLNNMEMTVTVTEEKGKIRGAIYGNRQFVKFIWLDGKKDPVVSATTMPMDLIKNFINHRLDAQYYGKMNKASDDFLPADYNDNSVQYN